MNLTITNLPPAGPADTAAVVQAADGAAMPPAGLPPAAGFSQWLDDLAAALPLDAAGTGADDAAPDAPHAGDQADACTDPAQDAAAVPQQPMPSLAAMAMPLVPAGTLAPAAAPLPLAQPGEAGGTADMPVQATAQQAATRAAMAAGAVPMVTPAPLASPAAVDESLRANDAPPHAAQATDGADATQLPAAPRNAVPAAASERNAAGDSPAPAAAGTAPGWGVAAPSANNAPTSGPAPVVLAGQPAAWRQALHEALGERLRVQAGNNIEQAVIRLEPPDLGRVDISIRHSAGTLQVALSATHSEVVRQLQNVSDNLRNDLAGRQYAEVTVSVSQTPRAQQGGFAGFGDQQQRQRQGGREPEDAAPGLALADAGGDNAFSLKGRE
ncbi:flagellar hook-length control protein FliK [Massilia agilis]|uniref:Flagellar hook-length control protein FliK n=1 Tax=Massilia agilis TaxID=1811226 RepID=A0ABT2DC44_9BURK|nr:flagellar hook-length control protein FliK [Massilia agilis]MCS0808903.1 flagellar hook-length control protein FliK [Massilia agilis]